MIAHQPPSVICSLPATKLRIRMSMRMTSSSATDSVLLPVHCRQEQMC